jgi:hypothetical protein
MQEVVSIGMEELAKAQEGLEGASEEEIKEQLIEVMVKVMQGMAFIAPLGPSVHAGTQVVESRKADKAQKLQDELHERSIQSKLAQEAPDKYSRVVAEQMREVGQAEVYIKAEALAEQFSPTELEEIGISEEVLAEAVFDGYVTVEAEQYVKSFILKEENYSRIRDHVKTDVQTGLTMQEALEWAETGLEDETEYALHLAEASGLDTLVAEEIEVTDDVIEEIPAEEVAEIEQEIPAPAPADEIIQQEVEANLAAIEEDIQTEIGPADAALRQAALAAQAERTELLAENLERAEGDPVFVAERELGLMGFFRSSEEAAMTPGRWKTYMTTLLQQAKRRREAREINALKEKKRQNSKEWKEAAQATEKQVEEELLKRPIYQAMEGLSHAEKLDRRDMADYVRALLEEGAVRVVDSNGVEIIPEGLPLERQESLNELPGVMDSVPRWQNRKVVGSAKRNGIGVEAAADLYGFKDGFDLVTQLLQATPFREAVRRDTEAVMRSVHGDMLTERAQIDEALREALEDDYSAVIAQEVDAMREARGEGRMKTKLVRKAARDHVRKMTIRKANPNLYLNGVRKQARLAVKALRAGDLDTALQHKYRQLVNYYAAQEVYKMRSKAESQRKYLNNMARGKNSFAKGSTWQDAIDATLGAVNYKVARPGPKAKAALQKKLSDPRYGVRQRAQHLLDEDRQVHWKDLTYATFTDVHDQVKKLHKEGVDEKKLSDMEAQAALDEEASAIRATTVKNMPEKLEANKWFSKLGEGADGLRSLLFHVDTILREADGFKDAGVVWKAIKGRWHRGMVDGYRAEQEGYLLRNERQILEADEIVSKFIKDRPFNKKHVNIGGKRYSDHQILSAVLTAGNEYGEEAILESGTFSEAGWAQVQEYVNDPENAWILDLAQEIWDYNEQFKDEIAASEQRRNNDQPKWVEAREWVTPDGRTYRGGYYHIAYRHDQGVSYTQEFSEEAFEDIMKANPTSSHTDRGHLESRKGATPGKHVKLDLSTWRGHISSVIYDLEMGDAYRDIYKIIYHDDVKAGFAETGNRQRWEMIELWFRDAVVQERGVSDHFSKGLRHLRSGFTMSVLGFNIGVAILQPLGILQGAVQLGKANTVRALIAVLRHPVQAFRLANEMSNYMKTRRDQFNKDVMDLERSVRGTTGFKKWMSGHAFAWIKSSQRLTDVTLFFSAYQKGLSQGMSDAEAITFAESMVSRTQASGIFSERSAFERGSIAKGKEQHEIVRSFTTLMSYFIAKYNVWYEQARIAKKEGGLKGMNRKIQAILMLYTTEAVLAELLRFRGPDEDDDESWIGWATKNTVFTFVSQFPLVRDVSGMAQGFAGAGAIGSIEERFARFATQTSQLEFDDAWVRSLFDVAGIVGHFPSKALGDAYDLFFGEDE